IDRRPHQQLLGPVRGPTIQPQDHPWRGGIEWTIKDKIPYHLPTLMKKVKEIWARRATNGGGLPPALSVDGPGLEGPKSRIIRLGVSHMQDSARLGGEALFLAQLGLIDSVVAFVCARHHLTSAEADDFSSHVRLKLIENDYAL